MCGFVKEQASSVVNEFYLRLKMVTLILHEIRLVEVNFDIFLRSYFL